jgi:hypothetical protein
MLVFSRAKLDRIAQRQNTCRFILQTVLGLKISPRPLIVRTRVQWSSTTSLHITFPSKTRI